MEINKALVRKHFDRHAHEYDQYGAVQVYMARKLLALLDGKEKAKEIPVRRILEIGCGTGNLTAELSKKYPEAEYIAIDLSHSMVEKTKEKLGVKAQGMTFIVDDAEEIALETDVAGKPFDLIISNAAFQWFNNPAKTIKSYLRALEPIRGVFAFSTFGPNMFRELHQSFRVAEETLGVAPAAHGQSFCTPEMWRQFFSNEEMRSIFDWYSEERIEIYPSVRNFLTHVKRIGAGNANRSGSSAGKRVFLQMERHYQEHHWTGDGIKVTYDLGFGVFQKEVDQ